LVLLNIKISFDVIGAKKLMETKIVLAFAFVH